MGGLTPWVRNLPDGRVEAWVEGAPEAVRSMAGGYSNPTCISAPRIWRTSSVKPRIAFSGLFRSWDTV